MDAALEALRQIRHETEELPKADMWCHLGTAFIRGPDEGYFSVLRKPFNRFCFFFFFPFSCFFFCLFFFLFCALAIDVDCCRFVVNETQVTPEASLVTFSPKFAYHF